MAAWAAGDKPGVTFLGAFWVEEVVEGGHGPQEGDGGGRRRRRWQQVAGAADKPSRQVGPEFDGVVLWVHPGVPTVPGGPTRVHCPQISPPIRPRSTPLLVVHTPLLFVRHSELAV